jgi:transposase
MMSTTTQMTARQRAIKQRLDQGMGAREIAEELGITRNAVYQQIQRLRRHGVLEPHYTPTGLPIRETATPGEDALKRLLAESEDEASETAAAGAMALVAELKRTRDELDAISRRLSAILPR